MIYLNYINNTDLTITYLSHGEVKISTFNTDQEFKDFMTEHNVILSVSTSRNYTEIPDTEIVQNYNALKLRFGI